MSNKVKAEIRNGQKVIIENNGKTVAANATKLAQLRKQYKNLTPIALGLEPSFGFGDRIGLATPGHVESLNRAGDGIKPIFVQQSIREMTRTIRSPRDVTDDAQFGMLLSGYQGVTGADADHLKTSEDVDCTAEVGFCFFTIDPSDYVDEKSDSYDETLVREKFETVREKIDWFDNYNGKKVKLETGTTIDMTEEAVMRSAVKYGLAINGALKLADHIKNVNEKAGREYEIELSVDETEQPTTLAEHLIIAEQCVKGGMKLVSLAPRFVGDFEKGVDYKGDLEELEKSLEDHSAIARMVGPYKLSLHSGSDKLSMYPLLSKATKGMFHVKTAGTSYLEALRVVAIHDEALFRRIIEFARDHYNVDKATYHVSGTVEGTPDPKNVSDVVELEKKYLERWCDVANGIGFTEPGRQILHCTFGSVLTDNELGGAVLGVLEDHLDTYTEVLTIHFAKHLEALQTGL